MIILNPRQLFAASAPVLAWLALTAACSSSSSKDEGDGGLDAPLADDGGGSVGRLDSGKKHPTGDSGKGRSGDSGKVDGSPGCGRCDASPPGLEAGAGHDTGSPVPEGGPPHDAGGTMIAPLGAHSTGQVLAVTTGSGVQMRTYDITVPADCTSPHPLIFIFHGDGGRGSDMYSGFPIEAAAQAAGGEAIFVYPDGLDNNIDPSGTARAWNLYTDPGYFPYSSADPSTPDNNDIDYFDAMVTTFEANYCVDPSRVFVTGMSAGGYAANQFARWRSHVIKGTAPQSGGAPFGDPDGDNGPNGSDYQPPNYCVGTTGAVPTLIIHGDSDTSVDPCNAVEAKSYWDLTNGCTSSANNCTGNADSCTGTALAFPSPAPTSAYGPSSADCVMSGGCTAPVVLCIVPGMGHSIWADAPTVIWGFFASL